MLRFLPFCILYVLLAACGRPTPPIEASAIISAPLQYALVDDWPGAATAATLGQPVGVAVMGAEVVVFHRGRTEPAPYHPDDLVVFLDAATGDRLRAWGKDFFVQPHGLHVDREGNVWTTDIARHQVFKFSGGGELLLTLGQESTAGKDRLHFDQPTDVAVGPGGNIFVTDGYGNRRIVKFDPDGNYLMEWGREGSGPAEFVNPHAIIVNAGGHLLISDRENNRVQKYDTAGNYLSEHRFGAPVYACTESAGGGSLYVTDYLVEAEGLVRGSAIYGQSQMDSSADTLVHRAAGYEKERCRYHDVAVGTDGALYLPDLTNRVVHKFAVR